MADTSLKTEYKSLVDTYIKFIITRTIVFITIILTLFNSIHSTGYRKIINNYDAVVMLKDSSWGIPMKKDWFIDGMFLSTDRGMYDSDSSAALRSANLHSFDPVQVDTAKISSYRKKQERLLDSIQTKFPDTFNLKLSVISDTPINLQYWIFLLPLLFILSAIYVYIISEKISIVEKLSGLSREVINENGSLNDQISPFDRYPFRFIKLLFQWSDIILVGIILYTYCVILRDIHGYIQYVLTGFLIAAYYGLIYTMNVLSKLNKKVFETNVFFRIWHFLAIFISKKLHRRKPYKSSAIGAFLILFTLTLVMNIKGCRPAGPINIRPTYFYHQDKWQKFDSLASERAMQETRGYEYLTHFKKSAFDFGGTDAVTNRFYQCGYVLTVLTVIAFLGFWIFSIFKPVDLIIMQQCIHYLFLMTCLLFIQFSGFLSLTFLPLKGAASIILLIIYVWFSLGYPALKYKRTVNNAAVLGKNMLLLCLPMLILLLKFYIPFIILGVLFLLMSFTTPGSILSGIWGVLNIWSLMFLHFGIGCFMIGLYKFLLKLRRGLPNNSPLLSEAQST